MKKPLPDPFEAQVSNVYRADILHKRYPDILVLAEDDVLKEALRRCKSGKDRQPSRAETIQAELDRRNEKSMTKKSKAHAVATLTVVKPADDLGLLKTQILHTHQLARNCAAHAVLYAAKTGALLLKAKEACGHGQFGKWINKNLPNVGHSTAAKYMLLADRLEKKAEGKFPSGGNLKDAKTEPGSNLNLLSLPDPRDLEDPSARRAIAAVQKVTDGKTVTQLYLELGIVKERKTKSRQIAERLPDKHRGMTQANKEAMAVIALEEFNAAWETLAQQMGNLPVDHLNALAEKTKEIASRVFPHHAIKPVKAAKLEVVE